MQLIDVVLRSVGHSSQKLWQKTFFSEKMPCILPYNAKKISNTISSLVRNLAQKAKWSKIFRRKRIQKPFRTTCGKVSFSNLYGFSPLWIKRCFYNSPAWLNDLSHCAHVCSFSPLWMRRCLLRFPDWLNVLSQSAQVYIFIPLCVIKCLFRCTDRLNVLLQSKQVFIFIPLCISKCVFRFPALLNALLK